MVALNYKKVDFVGLQEEFLSVGVPQNRSGLWRC